MSTLAPLGPVKLSLPQDIPVVASSTVSQRLRCYTFQNNRFVPFLRGEDFFFGRPGCSPLFCLPCAVAIIFIVREFVD